MLTHAIYTRKIVVRWRFKIRRSGRDVERDVAQNIYIAALEIDFEPIFERHAHDFLPATRILATNRLIFRSLRNARALTLRVGASITKEPIAILCRYIRLSPPLTRARGLCIRQQISVVAGSRTPSSLLNQSRSCIYRWIYRWILTWASMPRYKEYNQIILAAQILSKALHALLPGVRTKRLDKRIAWKVRLIPSFDL